MLLRQTLTCIVYVYEHIEVFLFVGGKNTNVKVTNNVSNGIEEKGRMFSTIFCFIEKV